MKKTAERRQELKEALIRAAEKTIKTKGLGALKARDLATDVGCALGAIYNVFPDLNALIYEVNARTLALFARGLERAGAAASTGMNGQSNPAISRLVRLALAYLDMVASNQPRWQALFEHRVGGARRTPQWYRNAQKPLFLLVEDPLRELRPELDDEERMALARSMFSAVHGVVSLGLDEKLMPMSMPVLRQQIGEIVLALGNGLLTTADRRAPSRKKRPAARRLVLAPKPTSREGGAVNRKA